MKPFGRRKEERGGCPSTFALTDFFLPPPASIRSFSPILSLLSLLIPSPRLTSSQMTTTRHPIQLLVSHCLMLTRNGFINALPFDRLSVHMIPCSLSESPDERDHHSGLCVASKIGLSLLSPAGSGRQKDPRETGRRKWSRGHCIAFSVCTVSGANDDTRSECALLPDV